MCFQEATSGSSRDPGGSLRWTGDQGSVSNLARRLPAVFSLLLAIAWSGGAAAAVITRTYGPFDVSFYNLGDYYSGYSGEKNWTETEMTDVGAMIQVWDDGILNAYGPRQIKINVMWNNLGSDTLGTSSNWFTADYTTAWTMAEELWRQGKNVDNANADGFYQFSTSVSWHTGASLPGVGEFDFRSVACHEIGHSLGFTGTYNIDTINYPNQWWGGGLTEWDKRLYDALTGGNQPLAGGTGTPNPFSVTNNPVYFDGTNAKAANGGNRVAIYAPSPYEDGSNLYHLNESTFPNALMSPQITAGQTVRQPTALEWQMMNDLGWNTVMKTWTKGAGTLQWGTAGNWAPSSVPDSTKTASFTNTGLSPGDTIILGGNRSVGSLLFDTTTNFTIGGTSGTLSLATGGLTRTAGSSGTQTIARPVALGANAVWEIAGSGRISLTGTLSGNYTLEKLGSGTLEIAGGIDPGGTKLIDVQAGKAVLKTTNVSKTNLNVSTTAGAEFQIGSGTHSLGSITGGGSTSVAATSALAVARLSQSSLTVATGAVVTIRPAALGQSSASNPPAAVPEPSPLVLLGLGAITLAGLIRRREKIRPPARDG
jgi:hypothetical protein